MPCSNPLRGQRLDQLEERLAPAQFGIPWTDGTHVTMSFVPDGADIDGTPSVLFQMMQGSGLSAATWQAEVVRAFMAWTSVTNLNVGVVADSGHEIGTSGPTQGDTRFGDVRISARPLSENVLAVTVPPGHIGGTRVGDITFNSNKVFSIGGANGTFDLYSSMLQETGHALGVGNSTNPASPMYEQYIGVRTGVIAEDVTAVKGLYGSTRAQDAFDESGANNSSGSADEIQYTNNADENALRSLVVRADVTSATDQDYYKFKTPKVNNGQGVTIRLMTGGFSSVTPRMNVYRSNQSVVGMVQSTNPLQGELSFFMPSGSFPLDTEYYIRVDSATSGNQYKIGSYQLKLVFNANATDVVTGESIPLQDDPHNNDTVHSSTKLSTTPGYNQNSHFRVFGNLRDTTDKDFYKLKSKLIGANQSQTMTLTVRADDAASGLAPQLALYNHNKVLISNLTLLVNGDGTYTAQHELAASDKDFFVGVSAQSVNGVVGVGKYHLDIDFRAAIVTLDQFASGTLTNADRTAFRTLEVTRSQIMHFVLSANGGTAGDSAVRMTIHDDTGSLVFILVAKAGETLSAATALAMGTYTIRFEGLTRVPGTQLPNLSYNLRGATIDDPIGPTPVHPEYSWLQLATVYYAGLGLEEPSGGITW